MFIRPPRYLIIASVLFFNVGVSAAAERWVIEFKNPSLVGSQVSERVDARRIELNSKLTELSQVKGNSLSLIRPFGDRGAVVKVNGSNFDQMRLRLLSNPEIESVEVDRRVRLHAQSPLVGLLNALDLSRRSRSWIHQDLASQPASINTGAMWANFHGTAPTVVAVLDTGVLPSHPMLQGHLLAGYDFVSDAAIAADGQAIGSSERDADPTDPGDGASSADLLADPACGGVSSSSWHGTFVSGLVAGNPVASEGVFSVNWNAVVLPVRVLGKCGGFSTDLADGIRWAAGLTVPGVSVNPFPAKVINLSLGAEGACVPSIEGAAIAEARQAGALVVVAAGNDGDTVDSPANCPGAFGVAAIDQEGFKANYSNFGSSIKLSAPGGDSAFPIWSASNSGLSGAVSNTYNTKIGTSFSSPMVAAAASLYWSLNPSASVDAVESALQSSARPFLALNGSPVCTTATQGVQCNCTSTFCGAGMLDVSNLINTVSSGGFTNLFSNSGNVIPPGQTRLFSAEGSLNALGQEVIGVGFSVLNVLKDSPDVTNPILAVNGLMVEITAPSGVRGFDLRVETEGGRTAFASVVVDNPGATSPTLLASLLSPLINGTSSEIGIPPTVLIDPSTNASGADDVSASAGGGGGGGSLNLFGLVFIFYLVRCFKRFNVA